ncbi:hypothetical protein HDU81_007751 [Chytriomyces hyalinus]|nr:hypothetical protein HDU81_007751 [Chytriomyces hyalinus]
MANDADTIDTNYVYALHTFVANVEGQVCVMKGDNLKLLDDTNYYWWLVKCVKTEEIGYIPAENIETPSERLARLNKFRNIQETLVNSQDAAEPPATVDPTKPRLVFADSAIVFENYDDIDYDDDYEDEEAVVEEVGASGASVGAGGSAASSAVNAASVSSKSSVQNDQSAGTSVTGSDESGKSSKRSSMNMNINTGFLKKLWTKEKSPSTASPSTSNKVTASNASTEPKKLINVLRIYTGNVDLKATYKAVALTQDMTTSALLDLALKRFRVENEPANNYFLSVLFMDSGEKPLDNNAIVFTALEALKNKNLPGVANFTRIEGKERAANVLMNDDNIIKVIINKKLNIFEKNYHLLRVYRFDEEDGSARTYKTIGVSSGAVIEEITEIVRDKFKVAQDPAVQYFLCTKVKGETSEKRRAPDEKIVDILATPDGTPIELEFIFRHEPASPETIRKRKLLADKTPKIATGDSTAQPAASGMDAILSGALPFLDSGDGRSPAVSEAAPPTEAGDEESDRQSSVSRPDSEYSARGSVTDEGCDTPQAGASRSRAQSTAEQNYVLESQQKSAKRGASDKISSGAESSGNNESTTNEAKKAWLPSA